MALPQIRIRYADLIDPFYQRVYELDPDFAGNLYPTDVETEKKVKTYRQKWKKDGPRILREMCRKLKLR